MNDIVLATNPYLFGICPRCFNSHLVYNSKNEMIECVSSKCDYSREYTAEDRKKVDKAIEEYYHSMSHWAAVYGEHYVLNDQLVIKAIFDKSKD